MVAWGLVVKNCKLPPIMRRVAECCSNRCDYVPGNGDRKATDLVGGLSSGYYITRKAWDDPEKRDAAISFIEYMTSDSVVAVFAQHAASALNNAFPSVNIAKVSSSVAESVLSGKYPNSYSSLMSFRPATHAWPYASSTFFGISRWLLGDWWLKIHWIQKTG